MMIQNLTGRLADNIVNSPTPSHFLCELRRNGTISYFPELAAMIGVPQEPDWHPEGDVWTHLLLVVDEAAGFKNQIDAPRDREIFMFGALCHDLGKPYTTAYSRGRWRSPGHDTLGAIPARNFLLSIGYDEGFIGEVVKYVVHHLKPANLYKTREHVSLRAIQRLADKIDIHKLALLSRADHFGRTIPEAVTRDYPAIDWLLEQYGKMLLSNDRQQIRPLVTGKMLLSLNMKPGKAMGGIIDEGLRLQSEGKIRSADQALEWAKNRIASII